MNRKVILGAAAIAVVALATVFLAKPGWSQPGGKDEPKKRPLDGTVNASGTGAVTVTADTAHVPMTLSATAKDHAAAAETLNKQKEKLITALKKQGFDKIHVGYVASPSGTGMPGGMMMGGMGGGAFINATNSAPAMTANTTGMSGMCGAGPAPTNPGVSFVAAMNPNAAQLGGQPNPKGPDGKPVTTLAVSITVVVHKTADYPGLVKSINEIRGLAADHGAANWGMFSNNPYTGYSGHSGVVLSYSKEAEARTKASVAALRDAEQNAKQLAQEAGIKLRDILAVSEPAATTSGTPNGMMGMGMMGMPMGAPGVFDHVTGQKELTVNVSVTYRH